jgi:hypothetical protein
MVDWWMNNELEKLWKEAVMVQLRFCQTIFLDRLRKTMKNFSQDSQDVSVV